MNTMKFPLFAFLLYTTSKYTCTSTCTYNETDLICKNVASREVIMDLPFYGNWSSIQAVTINYCSVPYIPMGAFKFLKNAKIFDLGQNEIPEIEPGAFSGIPNLQKLWLYYNNITEIKPATFRYLSNLNSLDLRNNQLTKIGTYYFSNLRNLRYLYVLSNLIETVSVRAFKGLTSLQYLDLSQNLIQYLPVGCFKDLGNLTILGVSNNVLTHLHFGTFTGLGKLRKLYLNNNNLTVIHEGLFLSLGQLKELYLNNNKLAHFSVTNLSVMHPQLERIGLNKNDFSCKFLFEIIAVLIKQEMILHENDTRNESNIYGIYCNDEDNSFETNESSETFSSSNETLAPEKFDLPKTE